MPIFRVKSVKIYTGQKNLHGYIRGIRDKYQVWEQVLCFCWNGIWAELVHSKKLTKHFIDCEPDTGSAAENKNRLIPFEKKISKKA